MASVTTWIACTGTGPGLRRTAPDDDSAQRAHEPEHRNSSSSLQLAGDAPVKAPPPAQAPTDPPLATKSARPLEIVVEKPDSLVEDTCMSCGGAIWRTLMRDVNPYPQIHGDSMLVHEKPNGGSLKIVLLNAKTGGPLWMRTIKSPEPLSLYLQSLSFLADGTIAAMIEENRGGRANRKVILLGMDGSRLAELDYDPSLAGLYLQSLETGFLVYGRRYAVDRDPVERTYLALHDGKGRPVGAWFEEKDIQVDCILNQPKRALLCALIARSAKVIRVVETDVTTFKVISKSERAVDWLRPFWMDGSLYYGVLEKPGNSEWSIFRVDSNGKEKLVLKTKRTLSTEMGGVQLLAEYGGRERRYFPLFSKSEEPVHTIVGPEKAHVLLGPGGDAFTSYEGILARWAAEKAPNGGTIATMKLLTR